MEKVSTQNDFDTSPLGGFELTEEMSRAEAYIQAGRNVFLTGGAGVGKSTFIKYLRDKGLNFVFLAPTGLIASNGVVSGSTLHSFFKIPFGLADTRSLKEMSDFNLKLLRASDCVIIDEVSMVRSDTFHYVDYAMRNAMRNDTPFGGKQVILIGDLFQLPPVVSSLAERQALEHFHKGKYFFQTTSFFYSQFVIVELTKVFRQTDQVFIDVLNKIKTGTASQEDLDLINQNVGKKSEGVILTPTNKVVDSYNDSELMMLSGDYEHYEAVVTGDVDFKNTRLQSKLTLKEGCKIMALVNSDGYQNGTIGYYRGISGNGELIMETLEGNVVMIPKLIWHNTKKQFDQAKEEFHETAIGSIQQYPVTLAYASSIHKSQGMTFDCMLFDIGNGVFDSGQLYVALSRCKSLEGLSLAKPITLSAIMVDKVIVDFYKNNK